MSRQAAAEQRRHYQEQIKAKEQEDNNMFSGNLFAAPKKMDPKAADSRFKEVLGDFQALPKILCDTPCIGVDYQPPTPARSEHIIGEPIRNVCRPAMIRAHSASNRLPSSPQPPRTPPVRHDANCGAMAPPAKPPAPSISSQKKKPQSPGIPKIDIHKKSISFDDLKAKKLSDNVQKFIDKKEQEEKQEKIKNKLKLKQLVESRTDRQNK